MHKKWLIRSWTSYIGVWSWLEQLRMMVRYWLKKPHETEYEALSFLKLKSGILLDVDANIGQSAAAFGIYDQKRPILSIEPNTLLKRDLNLASLWISNFKYRIMGLSDRPGKWVFSIPYVDGVALSQEATFDEKVLEDPETADRVEYTTGKRQFSIQRQEVECSTIDALAVEPALIKLDVQGHELPVLKGAEQTLQRHRPVLMIEYGSNFNSVRDYLSTKGFSPFRYDENRRALRPFDSNEKPPINVFFMDGTP